MQPLSWAKVAAGATVDPTTGIEYSIKPARRRQRLQPVVNKFNGRHCNTDLLRCALPQCVQSIQTQLSKIQTDNVVLAACCDKLCQDIKALREDIFRECRTDDFKDDDMEASRIALGKTLRPKAREVDCLCVACEEAAQKRHTALKQYRRANDKENLKRISSR